MKDNIIFSLDIGTRSVVGVVAEKLDDTIKVITYKSIFHEHRAMVDGQIEDIKKVSKVIDEVKANLEEELNTQFTDVYIAAAGRSLKTEKITFEKVLDSKKPLDESTKQVLEMDALQKAHDSFYQKYDNKGSFYCVGYSVLGYKLDGVNITNICGHRAEKVSIEIIAAFLPHMVVESLYACMDNCHLNVKSLTLEPIAAMNLVIPSELRLLNIALVDIGAGTSDIAVSKDGSIIGYDMATIAGDEITECIMKKHLVDFKTAEKIKVQLDQDVESVEFTDILGMTYKINKEDIINSISDSTLQLCQEIATKILNLNNEPPVAVFLIGGGSKTANIKKYLSEFLNLPDFRIAIGSEQIVKNVDITNVGKFGPEMITPVGIAYSSVVSNNYDFFSVIVNGEKVRLYNIRQMKVMDALLMAGFDSRKLMGFSGRNLNFVLNNKEYHYQGQYSTPAQISVNNDVANIETKICPGDVIDVVPAVDGSSPIVKIKDIVKEENKGIVIFNNTEITIGTKYMINGTEVDADYIIGNSDVIEIINIKTLKDLIALLEIDANLYVFSRNNSAIDLDTILNDKDIITVMLKSNLTMTSDTIDMNDTYDLEDLEDLDNSDETNVLDNTMDKADIDKKKDVKETVTQTDNINSTCFITVYINEKAIKLPAKKDNEPYIFADMLIYTDIDPTKPEGKIIILHNGKDACYTSTIKDGDEIIVKWQNSSNI